MGMIRPNENEVGANLDNRETKDAIGLHANS